MLKEVMLGIPELAKDADSAAAVVTASAAMIFQLQEDGIIRFPAGRLSVAEIEGSILAAAAIFLLKLKELKLDG